MVEQSYELTGRFLYFNLFYRDEIKEEDARAESIELWLLNDLRRLHDARLYCPIDLGQRQDGRV